MIVSTKGRYAARMLIDIAMNQGDGYVVMKDVARRQQISKKYLETFTAAFETAGILGVKRGKAGGYRLIVPAEEVSLWKIISLTDGPLHTVTCLEHEKNECARRGFCATLPAWEGLDRLVREYLENVTLGQLIRQAASQPADIENYPCGV